MGSNIIAHLIFFFPPHILLSAPMDSNVIAHLFFFPSTHSIRWYPNYHTFWNPYIHTIGSTIVLYIFPISLFAFHISFFNTLCVFGSRLKNQLILPFNLFLLLFMGPTTIFGIIHGSHCTISANFYLYLQYFQQKVFNFSKINESQTDSLSLSRSCSWICACSKGKSSQKKKKKASTEADKSLQICLCLDFFGSSSTHI